MFGYARGNATWSGSGLRIAGLGHYYPRTLVDQAGGIEIDGRSYSPQDVDELGVVSLHRAEDDETVPVMAAAAARAAIEDAGVTPADIDIVVLANWTDRQWIPELGPEVAAAFGAPGALAFDVCGACTGFVHGMQIAASLLRAHPGAERAVVVAADRFTRRARIGTRGQLVFGDAAGAVVLDKQADDDRGLIDSVLGNDASRADAVAARDGWLRPRPELIDLAVRSSIEVATTLLDRNNLTVDDVQWLVPHPGNNAIHSGVKAGLDLPEKKFVTNFATRGNTGCASIPIALSEYTAAGLLHRGDLVLSTAVGSGWYFGGLLYHL